MIVQIKPREWALYTRDGRRILGIHRTKADAKAQEIAVNISKARAAGHRIPRAPRKKR